MRKLGRLPALINGDRGAIATIFAIMISTAVIIAMFVMVFDVGSIYTERRVLQNASDSAVTATAQECAIDGTGAILNVSPAYASALCTSYPNSVEFATRYANLNSPDRLSSISELCGTAPLLACRSLGNGVFECKSVDSRYVNFARARTETLQVSGNSIQSLFNSLISSNDSNVKVVSCSQAAWGKAGFAPLLFPIALPICDYTIKGTKLISDFSSNSPVVIGGCTITDLNGQTFNYTSPTQGFSLLDSFGCPGVSAPRRTYVGDTLQIQASLTQVEAQCPNGSSQFYDQLRTFVGSQVFVPVVTSVVCQSGSNNCQGNYIFQVASFYSFKFLGGKFKNRGLVGSGPACAVGDPCQRNDLWPTACDSTRNCVYGTFEKAIVPGSDVSLDPSYPAVGAMAVQLLP